jgi:hypothetical protein
MHVRARGFKSLRVEKFRKHRKYQSRNNNRPEFNCKGKNTISGIILGVRVQDVGYAECVKIVSQKYIKKSNKIPNNNP